MTVRDVVHRHALHPADERRLLYMLGLEPTPGVKRQPRVRLRVRIKVARHGTRSAYVAGCGCPPCTTANTRYVSTWRRRGGGPQHRTTAPARPQQLPLFDVTDREMVTT